MVKSVNTRESSGEHLCKTIAGVSSGNILQIFNLQILLKWFFFSCIELTWPGEDTNISQPGLKLLDITHKHWTFNWSLVSLVALKTQVILCPLTHRMTRRCSSGPPFKQYLEKWFGLNTKILRNAHWNAFVWMHYSQIWNKFDTLNYGNFLMMIYFGQFSHAN